MWTNSENENLITFKYIQTVNIVQTVFPTGKNELRPIDFKITANSANIQKLHFLLHFYVTIFQKVAEKVQKCQNLSAKSLSNSATLADLEQSFTEVEILEKFNK